MRKRQFFAFILMILLLISVVSCKQDEQDIPSGGNQDEPAAGDTMGEDAPGEAPFSVRFETTGEGFDTVAGTFKSAGVTTPRDFSTDLVALRNRMTECNAFEICLNNADLTYRTLSGGSEPTGENKLYTITFVADNAERTITIDDAAIRAYATSNSNVSNINALIGSFLDWITVWKGAVS